MADAEGNTSGVDAQQMGAGDVSALVQGLPALQFQDAEALLRRAVPGQYVVFRAEEELEKSHDSFASVCVSFQTDDLEPAHNVVHYNVSRRDGAWSSFVGWVTIDPEPWQASDPRELLQSNMLFPTLEALCESLPVLTDRIHPNTGEDVEPAARSTHQSADASGESSGASGRPSQSRPGKDVEAGQGHSGWEIAGEPAAPGDAWQRADSNTPQFTAPKQKYLGAEVDKGVYNLLTTEEYALASAITATASRYGGELPALARIMIVHNHLRTMVEKITQREIEACTPLGLMQAESQCMVLWLVMTEVAGCPFLTQALGPVVSNVLLSRETFELDPQQNPDQLPVAAANVQAAVKAILDALNANVEAFPHCVAVLLYTMEQAIARQFGTTASATMAHYVFERFILEALLAPSAVGLPDMRPTRVQMRSLATIHQVLEKAATPDASFRRDDVKERHLLPLNALLPIARNKLSSFLSAVLSMGAPYAPLTKASAGNGGVTFQDSDMHVLADFLRRQYVEVYSALCDMRSPQLAAMLSARLRPLVFGSSSEGPPLDSRLAPARPHPIGLTRSAYQSMVPPPLGTVPNEVVERSQRPENALEPPPEASAASLGMGVNALATGIPDLQGKLGVGLVFRKDPYGLFHVLTIAQGSPAEASAVINKGDVLMNVNGQAVVGMSLAQIKAQIVGPPGTPVKLVFERPLGSTTSRYEVCLFRGHTKTGNKQMAPPTYAKHANEDSKVWHEMTKIFSEVEELQQRRTRAEKAFHAAEQLRQEYDAAAAESEVRASALRNEVDQVRIRLEKVRAEREVIDRDIAAQRLANEKAKSQQGIGLGMLPFVGGGGDATESSSSTGGLLSHVTLGKEMRSAGAGEGIAAPPQPEELPGPFGGGGRSGSSDGSWGIGSNLVGLNLGGLSLSGDNGGEQDGQHAPPSCNQQ